ncbi:MAG: pyruvate kinase [Desulfurococcales archaeon]|nr:pyruvate kinase [Desulfurococcales archaeon]
MPGDTGYRPLVKLLATLGPATSRDIVAAMAREGACGFRVNMSHGGPEDWARYARMHSHAEERAGRPLALIADLMGARARLGLFEAVMVKPGSMVRLGRDGLPVEGEWVFEAAAPGDRILIADGEVVVRVVEAGDGFIEGEVEAGEVIEPRKGLAVKGKEPPHVLTSKDKSDLRFAVEHGFSHVMLSYASRETLQEARKFLEEYDASHVRLLAKVETRQAVDSIGEIVDASDGIVVARGDLGMHYNLEEIPRVQALLVEEARRRYKPVILATELLSSMVNKPRPSRSDVVDVFNSVRLGVDGLLLTNETAVGRYPVEAVSWLRRIVEKALESYEPPKPEPSGEEYRLARGLVELVENLEATLIAYSMTGVFPQRISAFRPRQGYLLGVASKEAARATCILWGANPLVVGSDSYEDGMWETWKRVKNSIRPPVVLASWSRVIDHYRIHVFFTTDIDKAMVEAGMRECGDQAGQGGQA